MKRRVKGILYSFVIKFRKYKKDLKKEFLIICQKECKRYDKQKQLFSNKYFQEFFEFKLENPKFFNL